MSALDTAAKPPKPPKPQLDVHYPIRPASEQHLGFNGQITDPVIVTAAADLGAKVLRGGGAWASVEDPATGVLTLPAALTAGITAAHQAGILPMLVAGYGSPFGPVREGKGPAVFTVKEAKAGAYTVTLDRPLPVSFEAGHHFLAEYTGGVFAWAKSEPSKLTDAGLLITDVSGATLTLATKLGKELPVGTKLIVNRARYAPPGDRSLTNPWRAAYVRYLNFLAGQLGEGYICVWNEPPWPDDGSIDLHDLYDTPPKGISGGGMHTLLAQVWKEAQLPAGVKLVNGATDKLGGPGGLLKQYQPEVVGNIGANYIAQPSQADLSSFTAEGIHPYGKNPEASLPLPDLSAYVNPPVDGLSKFIEVIARHEGWGRAHGYDLQTFATECGGTAADGEDKQARELLRRVLSLWMCGVPLACIYNLSGKGPFSVASDAGGTLALRESGVALKRLTEIMASLGLAAFEYPSPPVFKSVEGNEWPIITGGFAGTDGSALFVWQRTWSDKHEIRKPDEGAKEGWWQIPSPAPATVTIESNLTLSALDLRTGQPVALTQAGFGLFSLPVSDDPVVVISR